MFYTRWGKTKIQLRIEPWLGQGDNVASATAVWGTANLVPSGECQIALWTAFATDVQLTGMLAGIGHLTEFET